MRTSENGLELIKSFEGLRLKAYRCPAGVMTIGYGHTKDVMPGMVCTPDQAQRWLEEDLAIAEIEVRSLDVNLTQNRFDALVSFTFNCGAGAFRRSTLRRMVLENQANPAIRAELGKWVRSAGRVLPGLVARREKEADLYFTI
ncbi:MAG: lysozyme [Candidatus Egerieousia sp.]